MERANRSRVCMAVPGEMLEMKRLVALLALSSALALAACDDPSVSRDEELADAPMEAPVAPAEEMTAPAADPAAVDTPPASPETLPPEKRSSEETVQPESETLFY